MARTGVLLAAAGSVGALVVGWWMLQRRRPRAKKPHAPRAFEGEMATIAASISREELNYALVEFRGVPINPSFAPAVLEELMNQFETRDSDVFVASYPKAGTTWMQTIVFHLAHDGTPPEGASHYATVPWVEALISSNRVLHARAAAGFSLADLDAMPADRPRFFKSHAPFADLPRGAPGTPRAARGVRAVYIARNPKDSVVSLWHHARLKPEFALRGPGTEVAPDFDAFVRLFLAGGAESGSWFDHNLSWWCAARDDPEHVLFLRYEDVYRDLAAAVRKIAAFIGKDATDEALVARTVEGSSMDAMRTGAGAINVRSGGSGKWRKMMSPGGATDRLFDAVYRQQMEGTGLTFDFGDGVVM